MHEFTHLPFLICVFGGGVDLTGLDSDRCGSSLKEFFYIKSSTGAVELQLELMVLLLP